MKKTWGETWHRVIDLGAEKATTYTKQKDAFIRAANWAQNFVAKQAGPIVDVCKISQNNLQNLLPSPDKSMDVISHTTEDIVFSAEGVKAYYFECDGNGTCTVTADTGGTTIALTRGEYAEYKGFASGTVTLTFSGDYSYGVRNVALYGTVLSDSVNDIPPFKSYVPYDISDLTKVDDVAVFMEFADNRPIHKGNYSDGEDYHELVDYFKEQDKIILLNNKEVGEFDIWYKRYPLPITAATEDGYELELDAKAADIVPFLMAYTLWADDSLTKATYWWNTADNMIQQLINSTNNSSSGSVYENTTGWW